ncbi:hypothetical protein [Argonema galeatum]|uniref:hypothetical protein n=1 Tax=Argonema galeatum TaxID=2942762 RepID=UPI0020113674|nr:hypothetical protein [Argonema galeatum]MCL1464390.1 hypothetical protein [Argonema galeatum A003/A1]
MDTLRKLELLKDTYSDRAELDRILGKLLEIALNQHRERLERYNRSLREFEQRYSMDSAVFYQRFEAGELGDDINFFEWSGLYELCQNILEKIHHLELAV